MSSTHSLGRSRLAIVLVAGGAAASLALEEALAKGPSAFVARTITERSVDQLEGGER